MSAEKTFLTRRSQRAQRKNNLNLMVKVKTKNQGFKAQPL